MSVIFGTADLCFEGPLKYALECGYRHIDTAQFYENEDLVCRVIAATEIPRKEITVISKVSEKVVASGSIRKSVIEHIKELGLEYVDVMLIHYPGEPADIKKAWRALERLVQTKKAMKIHRLGVSNFNKGNLKELLKYAKIPPTILQIHYDDTKNKELMEYCQKHGIHVQAYGVINSEGDINSLLDRDIDTVVGSNTYEHIKKNLEHPKKRRSENKRPDPSKKRRRVQVVQT